MLHLLQDLSIALVRLLECCKHLWSDWLSIINLFVLANSIWHRSLHLQWTRMDGCSYIRFMFCLFARCLDITSLWVFCCISGNESYQHYTWVKCIQGSNVFLLSWRVSVLTQRSVNAKHNPTAGQRWAQCHREEVFCGDLTEVLLKYR